MPFFPFLYQRPRPNCRSEAAPFTFAIIDLQTGLPLAGAVFELRAPGGVPYASSVSGPQGAVRLPTPPEGSYTLVETAPPTGYLPNSDIYAVTVDACGNVLIDSLPIRMFRVYSTREHAVRGSFTAVKIDMQTGARLGGALFELRYGACCASRAVSDVEGKISFSGLSPGAYLLIEVCPPVGYGPVSSRYSVTVAEDGSVSIDGFPANGFSIGNMKEVSLEVLKISDTGIPLTGARFQLRQGSAVIAASDTDAVGRAVFSALLPGSYTVVESIPPAGYAADPTAHSVDVAEDGSILVDGVPSALLTIQNTVLPFHVFFSKSDADTGLPLSGALFQLSGRDHVLTAVSDHSGRVDFGSLAAGNYTLTELSPPIGYLPDPAVFDVVISAGGSVTIGGAPAQGFGFGNIQASGLYVLSLSEENYPLAGGVFQLLQNDAPVSSETADVTGIASFGNPAAGIYALKESLPPAGFLPDSTVHTVTVGEDGSILIDGAFRNLLPVLHTSSKNYV